MSSIQPSSGAPMPPGAAVGPVANDPAVQAQIAEVNARLEAVNAQLGAGQPTGFAPAIEPGYIGMQGTQLVDSLDRARRSESLDAAAVPIGPDNLDATPGVLGGGPAGATPKLSDLIEQARIRRDIDQQMEDLGPTVGGGGGALPLTGTRDPLDVQAAPYAGDGSMRTGPYTGGAEMRLAGDMPAAGAGAGAAAGEEAQLEQLLSQMTPEELAQFEASIGAGGGSVAGPLPGGLGAGAQVGSTSAEVRPA